MLRRERIEVSVFDGVLWDVQSYTDTFLGATADALAEHTPDWPLPHERAHQDALWFCSGGDQLL